MQVDLFDSHVSAYIPVKLRQLHEELEYCPSWVYGFAMDETSDVEVLREIDRLIKSLVER